MISSGIDPQLLAKQGTDQADMIRFKQEMDGLKDRMAGNSAENKEKELRKACENFEAIFIGKLWKGMKSTIPKEGYLHSKQEDQYMSMFDREFSEKMAQAGGIGLADMIYEQMSEKLKETSRNSLTGGIQLNPLRGQPIAMDGPKDSIPLPQAKRMTLEDWGGDSAKAQSSEVVTSGTIISQMVAEKSAQAPMNDVDVKAQLEALTRRLEAERIKAGLLGNSQTTKVRSYGKEGDAQSNELLGRKLAEIG